MRKRLLPVLAAFSVTLPLSAQPVTIEFEPKVGVTGTRVVVKTPLPAGADLRFGAKVLPLLEEGAGIRSFVVPAGSRTSFLEYEKQGRVVGRSAVPFVVTDAALVEMPRLIGLKEAVGVFGIAEPIPESGEKPRPRKRALLTYEGEDILTIGENPLEFLTPAVELGDAASLARAPMSGTLFLFTVRLPQKKLRLTVPPPVPTPVPKEPD
jgi:hypothetical protein